MDPLLLCSELYDSSPISFWKRHSVNFTFFFLCINSSCMISFGWNIYGRCCKGRLKSLLSGQITLLLLLYGCNLLPKRITLDSRKCMWEDALTGSATWFLSSPSNLFKHHSALRPFWRCNNIQESLLSTSEHGGYTFILLSTNWTICLTVGFLTFTIDYFPSLLHRDLTDVA